MTDPLSVFDAAVEAPNAPFIVTRTTEFSFADVASLTAERIKALTNEPVASFNAGGIATLRRDRITDTPPATTVGPTATTPAPAATIPTGTIPFRNSQLRDPHLASEVPVPFPAENDVATVVTLLALFELGVPAMPLHVRWTDSERERFIRELPAPTDVSLPATPSDAHHECGKRILAVLHTSGSSGQPRGVALSRRAFIASAEGSAQNLGWEPNDSWLLCLPLSHIAGLSVLTRCLIARRPIVLDAAAALLTSSATLASIVPTQLVRLLETKTPCPRQVRAILVGGAALSPSLHAAAMDLGYPVLATYGSTETCSQIATQRVGTKNTTHVGPPLPGTEVRIVDGRIAVRGPTLASAFYPPEALPLDDEGWFVSQDQGEFTPNGELRVLGRADDVIITGGENVHPNEVEAALLAHPDVSAACVVGLADHEFGQRVFALLVTRSGTTPADLETHLRARLAGFKIPRAFLPFPALPLGPTGKVDRRAALDLATKAPKPRG